MYTVYVNHPNNKAIIHNENCGKFRGKRRKRTHNGYWKEGFTTLGSAIKLARDTRKSTVDTCAFCIEEPLD